MIGVSIRLTLWLALLSLITVASCGLDDFGVLSIEFDLEPTAIDSLPQGLDGNDFVTLSLATGNVHLDVLEGSGMVMAAGLPALPDSFAYVVMLQMAHGEREAVPGGEHEHEHQEPLETVPIGSLMATGGSWMISFDAGSTAGHPLGALRAAMVMIAPQAGDTVMVLFGEVREVDSTESEGGHEHGV